MDRNQLMERVDKLAAQRDASNKEAIAWRDFGNEAKAEMAAALSCSLNKQLAEAMKELAGTLPA